jgi:hypothetical protein
MALSLIGPEDDPQRVNQQTLHVFRSPVAETSGQVAHFSQQLVLVESEQDAQRTDHNRALLFGKSAQVVTANQPWLIYRQSTIRQDVEDDPRRVARQDLNSFRNFAPATVAGAPWYLWVPPISRIDPEDDARRISHNGLHTYRVGYQTVGQPFALWPGPQKRVEGEEYTVPPPSDFALTRVTQSANLPGQPWYLWPVGKADQSVEDDARRADHDLLHQYRTGYQTVGQSWAYWVKPQKRVDEEDYKVPGPASLLPYRQIAILAQPGQPWWAWPSAKADQTVEPNPVVIDHAALFDNFRPHQAITPVPVPDDAAAAGLGDYASAVVANRRRFELDRQLERQRQAQQAAEDEVSERERAIVRAKSEATREREQARLAKAVERQAKEARLTELIAQELSVLMADQSLAQTQAAQAIAADEDEAIILLLMM